MSITPSTLAFQDIWDHLSSRRLLLHTPLYPQPAPPPSDPYVTGDHSFDANIVMVLSVLLCALICSLGLNSIIRCALRCSSFVASESGDVGTATSRAANTGIKRRALKTFPTVNYPAGMEGNDECVICLTEFSPGERLRILPKCNHGFHVRCIDRWLKSHSSCPTCRHCLIETCQKIVGCTTSNSHETVVGIVPLNPERLVSPYRT